MKAKIRRLQGTRVKRGVIAWILLAGSGLLMGGCAHEIRYCELQKRIETDINRGFTFPGTCLYKGSDARYSYFEICSTGPQMGLWQECQSYKIDNSGLPETFDTYPLTTDKAKWHPCPEEMRIK